MTAQTFKTSRFGEIQVKPEDAIRLPKGLIGFPELKSYVLLDCRETSALGVTLPIDGVKWFQSLDDGQIAFLVVNPGVIKPDYLMEAKEAEVADLGLDSEEDAVLAVILTVGTRGVTANLKAPLVLNPKNMVGAQIISTDQAHTTRFAVGS